MRHVQTNRIANLWISSEPEVGDINIWTVLFGSFWTDFKSGVIPVWERTLADLIQLVIWGGREESGNAAWILPISHVGVGVCGWGRCAWCEQSIVEASHKWSSCYLVHGPPILWSRSVPTKQLKYVVGYVCVCRWLNGRTEKCKNICQILGNGMRGVEWSAGGNIWSRKGRVTRKFRELQRRPSHLMSICMERA